MSDALPDRTKPVEKFHSGLKIINPYKQYGRINYHRKIAYRLSRTAIGASTNRSVAMALMNMAGDIYAMLIDATSSVHMAESYRQAAAICYDKAMLIRISCREAPYKDTPKYIDGLRYAL